MRVNREMIMLGLNFIDLQKQLFMLSSPQGLVRYSKPFNNWCRFELGFSDCFVS